MLLVTLVLSSEHQNTKIKPITGLKNTQETENMPKFESSDKDTRVMLFYRGLKVFVEMFLRSLMFIN